MRKFNAPTSPLTGRRTIKGQHALRKFSGPQTWSMTTRIISYILHRGPLKPMSPRMMTVHPKIRKKILPPL